MNEPEALIAAIHDALSDGASDEVRAAGAAACRTLLGVLEAKAGEPIAPITEPASQIAAAVTALRGMPAEKLLDLVIARLRAALPPGATVAPEQPLNIPRVPLPGGG